MIQDIYLINNHLINNLIIIITENSRSFRFRSVTRHKALHQNQGLVIWLHLTFSEPELQVERQRTVVGGVHLEVYTSNIVLLELLKHGLHHLPTKALALCPCHQVYVKVRRVLSAQEVKCQRLTLIHTHDSSAGGKNTVGVESSERIAASCWDSPAQ